MVLETVLGALTGLVGNAVTSFVNYKTQKLKNEHDKAMGELELKKMEAEKNFMLAEAEANMKITQVETEAKIELADSKAYLESIKAAAKPLFTEKFIDRLWSGGKMGKIIGSVVAFLFGIIDFFKALMRPALTAYLAGVTTWITWMAWQIMQKNGQDLEAAKAAALFDDVTSIVIYLTVSCVTWWFGDRRTAKFLMRLNDGNIKR